MAIIHNQINKLWFKPSYQKFKKHGFTRQVFTSNEAEDFLRIGAYLIKEAEKRSNMTIPWDEQRRHEILANPRLENAFVSLGAEYFLKGVFLVKGDAINKPLPTFIKQQHPIKIRGNKSKLRGDEVQTLSYIVDNLSKIIDFSEFDKNQEDMEKTAKDGLKGRRLRGITRMTTPYPTAKQILDYIHFKRNYALHRPFIIPEFRGITRHVFGLLEYIAQKGVGKGLDELSILDGKTK